ncbi:MAG TPA: tetratricopeptide repeat protein [Chryseosolibacter sp.]|nr:tetratricopeptide repeat protein [Chryseosolibacter sp.]
MIKKILLLAGLALVNLSLCFSQKSSSKTFTFQYEIDKSFNAPDKVTKYRPELMTTLSTEQYVLNDIKKHLVIPGSFYSLINESLLGSEDWVVTLHTGDVTMGPTTDKPVHLLAPHEDVFTYRTSAKVAVTDKSGAVVWEKVLADASTDKVMTKRDMFIDKSTQRVNEQRPEEMKPATDRLLADKNKLVLYSLADQARQALLFAFNGTRETMQVSLFSVKGKAYGELDEIRENIFDTYLKYRALSKKNRLPKEAVDEVFRKAIPLWEKVATEDKTLEEKATKGLLLNCAVAYCWLGEYDKAKTYLDKVPEAAAHDSLYKDEPEMEGGTLGATTFLSFDQSAAAAREMQFLLQRLPSEMKFTQ